MTRRILFSFLICFSLTLSKAQTITVSNTQLNFGVAFENAPDSLPLILYNNLGKPVNVTGFRFYNIYGQPAFSCSSSAFTIYDGSSHSVWIKFSPQHNIMHNSELVIENDAQRGYVTVDLLGQGRYSKTYYDSSENLEEEALKTELKNITGNGYASLGYNVARDSMFMSLDNQKTNGQGATQNTLECIYTGRLAVGYIDRSDCQTNDQFNTEHTFPQGFFSSMEPMKSDLHHLFPTDDVANNTRASYPFGMVTNATWSNGGSKFDNNTNIFEPRNKQKGCTARAMLYFVIRYQNYTGFLNSQEAILKTWNHNFIPSTVEQVRNEDIYALQNNRNPFVDYPQFADRITSFSNLSVAPINYAIDETQNEINYGLILYGTSNVYHYVIVNDGNQTVQFNNFNLSNPAILSFVGSSGSSISLNPGEALGVDIDLHPQLTGPVNETLTFQTNMPALPNVSIPIIAQSSAVGVQEIDLNSGIEIYPNPANDLVKISGVSENKIKITTILGEQVFVPVQQNNNELILNISGLPQGIYNCFITSSNQTISKKIAVIKN